MSNKIKDRLRKFGLTNLAVDNATSIFILTFMILLFGMRSYINTPKEAYPEVTMPQLFVNTVYFGNAASDIENLVTRPLEKEIADITEIKKVTSSSLQDYSIITAEFESDMDMDFAVQKIKDAVDKAKPELPNDLTNEPEVIEINMSELPIMTVNVSGDFPSDELRAYAEFLEEKIEDLPQVSKIDMKGTLEREVQVNVDIPKMESLQVSFADIENAFRSENMNMSGGEMVNNEFRRNIRVLGEFDSPEEMERMIVKSENQNPIYLRDIADVKFGFKDRTSISRADQRPVISLDVIKESGENLLIASDNIKAILDEAIVNDLPKELDVKVFNDLSVQTRDLVSNLENSIISGVILVVLVLLFFLGLRNASFVGVAIPLSMLMGVMILSIIGYTMNMVVLFALILALGMLVDNAIVVVENIYRYMQEGYPAKEAAKYGAGEVALPIIASTATTIAAFLPLAFWPGLMGSFMKYLPITLIVVLSSSLFLALVINPVLTASFMKIDERASDKQQRRRKIRNVLIGGAVMLLLAFAFHTQEVIWARNLLLIAAGVSLTNFFLLRPMSFFFQGKVLPALERVYNKFIRGALYKVVPTLIIFGTVGLLFLSSSLLTTNMPKVEFFPIADPLYVNAFVELPLGKDITATDKLMTDIEAKITEVVKPYGGIVEAVLSQIGENTTDPNAPPEFGASPHKARLTVSFVPSDERGDISTVKIMEEIRASVSDYAGVNISVAQNQDGPPTGRPINLELKGGDVNELAIASENIIAYINSKDIDGIERLMADVKIGKPELLVNIDREAARRYGVSTYNIADGIRTAVFGKEISKFKEDEEEYPIQLRVAEKYRYNVDDIINQKVTFRSPSNGQISQVPISAVADVDYSSTYSSILRKDQERIINVYSNVKKGYNANEIVEEIKDAMEDYEMPEGMTYVFSGQQEEQAKELAFLSNAFLIAMFVIFIILVAQFNSIIAPFIIILSVVFSTIGVLFGYVFTGRDLIIIMTGVGIISLAGIVVNNAIVLIDYINLLVKNKREELGFETMNEMDKEDVKDAIILGGSTRLRPVLLTAITTVLGLIPLAIGFNFNFFTLISDSDPQLFIGGDNAAFWGPMAWTVIYGLVFATFLTLVVVPAMYWVSYRMKSRVGRLFAR